MQPCLPEFPYFPTNLILKINKLRKNLVIFPKNCCFFKGKQKEHHVIYNKCQNISCFFFWLVGCNIKDLKGKKTREIGFIS